MGDECLASVPTDTFSHYKIWKKVQGEKNAGDINK